MHDRVSRREFLIVAGATAAASVSKEAGAAPSAGTALSDLLSPTSNKEMDRIVDIHVHFDEKNPHFIDDLVKVAEPLNMTACVLTPYPKRRVIADAAKQYPKRIIPFGSVDLDAPDVVRQVQELHTLGYRGLGELEFVKRAYTDPSYMPVYELANQYGWVVLFHTGIVLRRKFDEAEDVASYRMRAFHLDEIARRFPKITVVGAHCGNPEYEWAAEVTRWNPNVFFDLSGTTLTKMRDRLGDFKKIFWWSGQEWDSKSPENNPSAFVKLVFGSDTSVEGIEGVVRQYRALFEACGVPESAQKLILGGTLTNILNLPK